MKADALSFFPRILYTARHIEFRQPLKTGSGGVMLWTMQPSAEFVSAATSNSGDDVVAERAARLPCHPERLPNLIVKIHKVLADCPIESPAAATNTASACPARTRPRRCRTRCRRARRRADRAMDMPSRRQSLCSVEKSCASRSLSLLKSGITTRSYKDTAVTKGKTYYYYVTAVKNGVQSKPSNLVSATAR